MLCLRFLHQRERFIAALVRPLVWLVVYAAGFRNVLGVSIVPPYETYIVYEVYITPGLVGDAVKDYHMIEDGDVVAFSGAVPYSYGYGSPVV